MLTRSDFVGRFTQHAVFGMVHLPALPGAPRFGGSIDEVTDAAIRDARALHAGGADGLVFENFGDVPFFPTRVEPETIAAMTRVITEVTREVRLPFGVNVLRNDALGAMAVAAATGAAFIRVNVHTGAMLTDQGLIEGDAAATLRKRSALRADVAIFADHLVKHATPLGAMDVVQSAKDLRLRGLADALIVTGAATGAEAEVGRLQLLRDAIDAPLIIGSGLTPENAALFAAADGAIVGTSLKVDGVVDAGRVAALVKAFKKTSS